MMQYDIQVNYQCQTDFCYNCIKYSNNGFIVAIIFPILTIQIVIISYLQASP